MIEFCKNIFNITNNDMHKCLCIFGIKFKWINKTKLLEKQINNIKNELVFQNNEMLKQFETNLKNFTKESSTNIVKKTDEITLQSNKVLAQAETQIRLSKEFQQKQEEFKTQINITTNSIKDYVSEISKKQNKMEVPLNEFKTELLELKSNINNITVKANEDIQLLRTDLYNLKNSNQIDFMYKNIDNPSFEFLYNDLYKMFTSGEYYSMKNIYVKRLNKYTIDQNIAKIQENYNKEIYLLTDISENIDSCCVIGVNDIQNLTDKNDAIFVLAYNQDYSANLAIRELQKYNFKYLALEQYGTPQARYYHINEIAYRTLQEESLNNPLLHFCPGDFENIFQVLEATKNLEGDYVEIGTFQGASARATLHYRDSANINKKCYFVDTYEGFTYDEAQTTQDILWTNTHTDTSVQKVQDYLSNYDNYELIKSNIIQDELPEKIKDICAVNIDVDMYEAVKSALYRVKDRVVRNGIVIAEDYGHTPALIGAQKAVDEFLQENPNDFIPIYLHSGQMFLIKKG